MEYRYSYEEVMADHNRRLEDADIYRKYVRRRDPGRVTIAVLTFIARVARGLAIRLEDTVESMGSREHSGSGHAAA